MAAGLLMGLAGVLGNGMDCDRLRITSSLLSSYQNIIMPFMAVKVLYIFVFTCTHIKSKVCIYIANLVSIRKCGSLSIS